MWKTWNGGNRKKERQKRRWKSRTSETKIRRERERRMSTDVLSSFWSDHVGMKILQRRRIERRSESVWEKRKRKKQTVELFEIEIQKKKGIYSESIRDKKKEKERNSESISDQKKEKEKERNSTTVWDRNKEKEGRI
jgi:hypothetical protein